MINSKLDRKITRLETPVYSKNRNRNIVYMILTATLTLSLVGSLGNSIPSAFAQQESNVTYLPNSNTNQTNPTLNNLTTFTASGFLRSLQVPQQNADNPYILFGYWNASVNKEDLSNFYSNFTMSRTNGSELHSHQIVNFKPTSSVLLNTPLADSAFMFTGTADIHTNNQPKWTNVDVAIFINNFNTISIAIDSSGTDNHFNGQPIGGIVESVKDPNMNELLILVINPAPMEIPVVPSGNNSSAETNQMNTGNTDNSGILTNIGDAIKDLFTYGDQR